MPEDNEFSSTMRIDIPPDLLADAKQKTAKVDTAKIRIRPPGPKLSRSGAVEAANTKFEQLLQSIYDAALITDRQGRIIDSNVRSCEFFLYSRAEFQQLSILDTISGAESSLLDTLYDNLQNERFALLQAYCTRKDGTYFPAEIAVNILKLEEMRLCFFVRDVTVRRQAEEMLRTEHNAIQNAGNGIVIANVDARIEYANPAVVTTWGFDNAEELLGKDIRTLLTDEEASEQMVRTVLSEHQTWSGELMARKKDASAFDVQISAACNRDSDGEVVGMVLSFADISDRKRAEEAVRQAERQRVMLASVGAACHHLGQPATVIMTNIELIKRMTKAGDNVTLQEILRLTNEAAETMAEVLHKLNAVTEFRTVQYLDSDASESPENVILDI